MTKHGRKATEPVVVLLHWDGWVEVYGHVDARIINVPDVPPPADQFYNPAGEILAEQYGSTAAMQWNQALQFAKDSNLTLTLSEKPAHPDASDDGWCYDI
ncbi:hypothetical protein OAH34_01035 [bacterium]|nr:hypothetical protein [bacterium]